MLITVIYQNGKHGVVESLNLDELISSNKIKQFLRSDGWCTIGIDPVRKYTSNNNDGHERRQSFKKTNNDKKNKKS